MESKPDEPLRRQYWIVDVGEYEYPVYVVADERKHPWDVLVYLQPEDAEFARKLHDDWLTLQDLLCTGWRVHE